MRSTAFPRIDESPMTPHPLTPSPRAKTPCHLAIARRGEGVGFLKGDGGGFATPIPFGSLIPLSAIHLVPHTSLSAERGVRGVRLSKCHEHSRSYPPPREEI